jgi:phage baseplate assembly protein W
VKSGIRKTYDFKSVGELSLDEVKRNEVENPPFDFPIGIKTPLAFTEEVGGFLKMHRTVMDQVADNFRNLVMTNHGDRLGHFDFGANLRELAFELGSSGVDEAAMRRIARTTEKYMPYVQLDSFEPFIDHQDNEHVAKIGVKIRYSVPSLSAGQKALEVLLYVAG